jgi:hypothetical protein
MDWGQVNWQQPLESAKVKQNKNYTHWEWYQIQTLTYDGQVWVM